jgi:hypothetical protein
MVIKMHINDSQNIIPYLKNSSQLKSIEQTPLSLLFESFKKTAQQPFSNTDCNSNKPLSSKHEVKVIVNEASLHTPLLKDQEVDKPENQWLEVADRLVEENSGKYEPPTSASAAENQNIDQPLGQPLGQPLNSLGRIKNATGSIFRN